MTRRTYDVLLGDEPIGLLAEDEADRISFRFLDGYRAQTKRAVLSQSFEDDLARTYAGKRPGQLPPFFSNLLPEGRLRDILESSLGLAAADDLGLLAATCEDLPGAVGLRPTREVPAPDASDEVVDNGRNGNGDALGFRFSLGGVQLKFSMVRQNERLTMPAHGGRGDWIVKLGSGDYPGLAENEYTMMQWARRAGFDVPECEVLEPSEVPTIRRYAPPGSRVFAIRRFDRQGGERIHQEDFMQVFGWGQEADRKYRSRYEDLATVVRALLGEAGYEEFVRRLVLVVATANNDAHLKNWALVYPEPSVPVFSPVYDQVCTAAWAQLDRTLALKLAGAREFGRVDLDSFRRMAAAARANPDQTVAVARDTAARLLDAWRGADPGGYLPRDHVVALAEHWKRVPLLRATGELAI